MAERPRRSPTRSTSSATRPARARARRREEVVAALLAALLREERHASASTGRWLGGGSRTTDAPGWRSRSGALVSASAVSQPRVVGRAGARGRAGPGTAGAARAALGGGPARAAGQRTRTRRCASAAPRRWRGWRPRATRLGGRAARAQLVPALAALDAAFTELTGRAPSRNHGRAYGARTLAYPDCLRDLDVTLGPAFLADVAPAVTAVFEAGRWFSGRIQAIGEAGRGGDRAARPRPVRRGRRPAPRPDDGAAAGHRGRGRRAPAPLRRAARRPRAGDARGPRGRRVRRLPPGAWPHAGNQSVDLQLVARDAEAIAAGDYLAVVGDMHPGDNPLAQALFGLRHPDPARFARHGARGRRPAVRAAAAPVGPGHPGRRPRHAAHTRRTRSYVALFDEACAPHGARTWRPDELWVRERRRRRRSRGAPRRAHRGLRAPDLRDGRAHVRAVAGERPRRAPHARQGRAAARDLARPGGRGARRTSPRSASPAACSSRRRRSASRSTVDLESPVLSRIARRHIRAAAAARRGRARPLHRDAARRRRTAGWPGRTAGATRRSCGSSASTDARRDPLALQRDRLARRERVAVPAEADVAVAARRAARLVARDEQRVDERDLPVALLGRPRASCSA